MHEIELPLKVIIGMDVLKRLPSLIKKLNLGNDLLVLTGPHVYEIIGKDVISLLVDSHYEVQYQIVRTSTLNEVRQIEEIVKEIKPSIMIAVGGGKVIDVTKYTSYLTHIPFVSVPTAASHDGIASPVASIKLDDGRPGSFFTKPPIMVVADVSVISKAPKRLTASGCGDVIGKITAVRDARLARVIKGEYVGDYALSLALMSAKLVMRNASLIAKGSPEGIRVLLEALISCGTAMAIAGSSKPCSGSEHLFSHALDLIAPRPALHGEQVGVGTIMMSYLHGLKWKRIRGFLKQVGAPINAKELGIEPEYIIRALTIAHKMRKRYTILGESGLTWKAAEALARETEVIE
ncbi:MAG: NAD(P)-dependent glycerol-1-phosphate dehydrogenase [Thermoprotei archaeon]|nr:MAG: NAD(P)-dependent glycerol-1-phosphate dehydrogenase [Thermoprotei archaeon]RLF19846.1 MAG: NAD(P)-dependent glycerol-1-phosphate dehydrogenase [Thermoprotei archaeon]